MGSEPEGAAGPAPPTEAGDPQSAAQGAQAIERILRSTEAGVAQIEAHAREEGLRISGGAGAVAMRRRAQLAQARTDLIERATALAQRFEEILDLLEAAERELAGLGLEPADPPPPPPLAAVPAEPEGAPAVPIASAPPAPALPPRRARRGWRRWLWWQREAA
jgi:hypothetical protein